MTETKRVLVSHRYHPRTLEMIESVADEQRVKRSVVINALAETGLEDYAKTKGMTATERDELSRGLRDVRDVMFHVSDELNRIGVNLNQIARILNSQGFELLVGVIDLRQILDGLRRSQELLRGTQEHYAEYLENLGEKLYL